VLETIVARMMIVLVVFPVAGHAIYMTMSWVFSRALPALMIAESWAVTVDRGIMAITILVAGLGAWNVCRRLWPITPMRIAR
jgi:hypothetical protein